MKVYRKTIIEYLYDHAGEEMTTYQLLQNCYGEVAVKELDNLELMRIDRRITDIAKSVCISLDKSKYDEMVVGLPYNIPFVITRTPFGKETKIRGNKYDAPFMSMDRETAKKIADQSTPIQSKDSANSQQLPDNWEQMMHRQRVCWFIDNFGTDEDDEDGYMIYDTGSMSEEVLEAYKETIEYKKEMSKKGIMID